MNTTHIFFEIIKLIRNGWVNYDCRILLTACAWMDSTTLERHAGIDAYKSERAEFVVPYVPTWHGFVKFIRKYFDGDQKHPLFCCSISWNQLASPLQSLLGRLELGAMIFTLNSIDVNYAQKEYSALIPKRLRLLKHRRGAEYLFIVFRGILVGIFYFVHLFLFSMPYLIKSYQRW